MAVKVSCPVCGKRFQVAETAVGKRVRCSGCREPFTAEAELDLGPVEMDPLPASPPAQSSVAAAARAPRFEKPMADSTETARVQAQAIRMGQGLVVLGALGLILPFIGLQHRFYRGMGTAAATVATCLLLAGGLLWAGASTSRGAAFLRHFNRWGTLAAKIFFIALLVLLLIVVGIMVAVGSFRR